LLEAWEEKKKGGKRGMVISEAKKGKKRGEQKLSHWRGSPTYLSLEEWGGRKRKKKGREEKGGKRGFSILSGVQRRRRRRG